MNKRGIFELLILKQIVKAVHFIKTLQKKDFLIRKPASINSRTIQAQLMSKHIHFTRKCFEIVKNRQFILRYMLKRMF